MEREAGANIRKTAFRQFYLPAIAYAFLILGLSSIPDLSPPIKSEYPVDKVIHFLEYAGFCYFVLRLCTRLFRKRTASLPILATGVIVALFAVADETYQRLIPGRSADPMDVVADISGALVILAVVFVKNRTRQKTRH